MRGIRIKWHRIRTSWTSGRTLFVTEVGKFGSSQGISFHWTNTNTRGWRRCGRGCASAANGAVTPTGMITFAGIATRSLLAALNIKETYNAHDIYKTWILFTKRKWKENWNSNMKSGLRSSWIPLTVTYPFWRLHHYRYYGGLIDCTLPAIPMLYKLCRIRVAPHAIAAQTRLSTGLSSFTRRHISGTRIGASIGNRSTPRQTTCQIGQRFAPIQRRLNRPLRLSILMLNTTTPLPQQIC